MHSKGFAKVSFIEYWACKNSENSIKTATIVMFFICDLIVKSDANAFVNICFTSTKLTKENEPR